MTRTYECRNQYCVNYREPVHVNARPVGIYWEWPNVICDCGSAVPIVAIDGEPLSVGLGTP